MSRERMYNFYPGDKIGRLTVIREVEPKLCKNGKRNRFIECKCDCGNITCIPAGNLIERPYRKKTESCGCILSEMIPTLNITHGLTKHPIHSIWASMKGRTANNPNHQSYHSYYGAGVRLCPEWEEFLPFYNWAIDKWKRGLELDKDILYYKKFGTSPGLLYSPEFCCFVTRIKNSHNRSVSTRYDYNGEKLSIGEIAALNNIPWHRLYNRIKKRKMTIEESLENIDYRVHKRTIKK